MKGLEMISGDGEWLYGPSKTGLDSNDPQMMANDKQWHITLFTDKKEMGMNFYCIWAICQSDSLWCNQNPAIFFRCWPMDGSLVYADGPTKMTDKATKMAASLQRINLKVESMGGVHACINVWMDTCMHVSTYTWMRVRIHTYIYLKGDISQSGTTHTINI